MQAVAALLSMVFFLVLAGMAVLHISNLQDNLAGQEFIGGMAALMTDITVILLMGGVGMIALVALAVWLLRNVR